MLLAKGACFRVLCVSLIAAAAVVVVVDGVVVDAAVAVDAVL